MLVLQERQMANFHISKAHTHQCIGMDSNLPFWISMIQQSEKVLLPSDAYQVLDFGCGEGKFLHLFDVMKSLKKGVGIELDAKLVKQAQARNQNVSIDYYAYTPDLLAEYSEQFDVVYSQEVLYTQECLSKHAAEIFKVLKPGGFYFATLGCHTENPLWSHRREIIKAEESYPVCDYCIDQVAQDFYQAGFEVGIKRLPVEYFIIYHPEITPGFSKSYSELVSTTYENKMLFSFWKSNE